MTEPERRPVFGVVAEDKTDCEALAVAIRRIARRPSLAVEGRKGDGCGGIASRGDRLILQLERQYACTAFVVLHDLDKKREPELRDSLNRRLSIARNCLICIPAEELEAWFWSDQAVLDHVSSKPGLKKALPNPHLLDDPKGALEKLSLSGNKRPRYTTNKNPELMKILDFALCAKVCPAFKQLQDFVLAQFASP